MPNDLLNLEIVGLEDEAVSRNLVTGLKLNDISDDHLPDRDGLHGAILASEDGQRLFSVQTL